MKEKLFLDTNIILDIMLNRIPFNVAAAESLPVDCIITRNEKHFRLSSIPVRNAIEYLLER